MEKKGELENMPVTSIFSFLVHPSKGEENQPEIGGTAIPLETNLGLLLSRQFEKASEECRIEIAFRPQDDGTQRNDCRDDLISAVKNGGVDTARLLATRLQKVTTNRSGLGLLFLIVGREGATSRIYLARFPADFGIVAEERQQKLHVELIEKVFMRNALAYKAVTYEGKSFHADFWTGKAVDRQISNNSVAISGYWISEFLQSDFQTTSATGTRRLALAIKQTIDRTHDLEIKDELSAAARLARTLNKKPISIENFWERFGLSDKTRDALLQHLSSPAFRFDQFVFSAEEFSKHIRYRSVSINNGAMLTAPAEQFDDVFSRRLVAEERAEYEFTTRGTVVDERLKASAR